MSAKIQNSQFSEEIEMMIESGRSSRRISTWLSERGENISHVTISQYRQSLEDHSSKSKEAIKSPENMVDQLKERMHENILNPVKLKHYLDCYLKIQELDTARKLDNRTQFERDMEHLSKEEQRKHLMGRIVEMCHLLHPSVWTPMEEQMRMAEENPQIVVEWDKWRKALPDHIERLCDGEIP